MEVRRSSSLALHIHLTFHFSTVKKALRVLWQHGPMHRAYCIRFATVSTRQCRTNQLPSCGTYHCCHLSCSPSARYHVSQPASTPTSSMTNSSHCKATISAFSWSRKPVWIKRWVLRLTHLGDCVAVPVHMVKLLTQPRSLLSDHRHLRPRGGSLVIDLQDTDLGFSWAVWRAETELELMICYRSLIKALAGRVFHNSMSPTPRWADNIQRSLET